jgi:hypothetical protein
LSKIFLNEKIDLIFQHNKTIESLKKQLAEMEHLNREKLGRIDQLEKDFKQVEQTKVSSTTQTDEIIIQVEIENETSAGKPEFHHHSTQTNLIAMSTGKTQTDVDSRLNIQKNFSSIETQTDIITQSNMKINFKSTETQTETFFKFSSIETQTEIEARMKTQTNFVSSETQTDLSDEIKINYQLNDSPKTTFAANNMRLPFDSLTVLNDRNNFSESFSQTEREYFQDIYSNIETQTEEEEENNFNKVLNILKSFSSAISTQTDVVDHSSILIQTDVVHHSSILTQTDEQHSLLNGILLAQSVNLTEQAPVISEKIFVQSNYFANDQESTMNIIRLPENSYTHNFDGRDFLNDYSVRVSSCYFLPLIGRMKAKMITNLGKNFRIWLLRIW